MTAVSRAAILRFGGVDQVIEDHAGQGPSVNTKSKRGHPPRLGGQARLSARESNGLPYSRGTNSAYQKNEFTSQASICLPRTHPVRSPDTLHHRLISSPAAPIAAPPLTVSDVAK